MSFSELFNGQRGCTPSPTGSRWAATRGLGRSASKGALSATKLQDLARPQSQQTVKREKPKPAPEPSKEEPLPAKGTAVKVFQEQQASNPQQKPPKAVLQAPAPVPAPAPQKKKEFFSEGTLAHKMMLPFDIVHLACTAFRENAELDPHDKSDLFSAVLHMKDFERVLASLCGTNSVDELSGRFVVQAFRTADRDGNGELDVEEFCTWYSSFSFSEEMVLNKGTQHMRQVARKCGVPVVDIEHYKRHFDKFDTNLSGFIEMDEFQHLLHKLLKVPEGQSLPHSRVMSLWRTADSNGNGEIDFEEFCEFYMKIFEQGSTGKRFEFSDFYKSIRPVSV